MTERDTSVNLTEYSMKLAEAYERQQKNECGIKHSVPDTQEPKQQSKETVIICKCAECNKDIYNNKSCSVYDKHTKKVLVFCNRFCAEDYFV